jgi:TolB-like protein/tetratricopeptide (TPR) repeat protein
MSETIGHYEVLGLLGTGGLGTVYRARDTRVGRTVAIRVLGDTSSDAVRREAFIEAVRPFTQISHAHVATLFEVGEHRDCAYLVYEYVPGERLGALAAGHPLNLRRALDLTTQVADGLAEAHAFGLLHGALTPTSIAVTPKGHAKILDLGLSVWSSGDTGRHTAARLAERGTSLGHGTVAYMSPEQILGQPIDHRTDVFSLGVILYQLLTGRQPFDAANDSETGVTVVQHTPPPPSQLNRDVPVEVDTLVAKALAKDVDERYQSVAAFAADLRAASSVVLQRDVPSGAALAPSSRADGPSPWRMVLLVALLLAALGVAGWTFRQPVSQLWQSQFGPTLTPVISVMPFTVEGGDESRAYVGAGLAEEVARRLGHLRGVTVTGRSTMRQRAGLSVVAVARTTKASLVLTGTIGPGPDGWTGLDIAVELADGKTGRAVWSQRYQGPATDVGAVQARIARDIVTRLKVPISPSATRDRAALRLVDADAYDAYLRGRDALSTGDAARAAQLFENAILTDPGSIDAQAALAEVLYLEAVFESRLAYSGVQARMRQAAEEASTADPDLATAQLALGLSAPTIHDALGSVRKAIELDRSFTNAYLMVADMLRDIDPARAIRFARSAAQLDPSQPLALYYEAAADLAMNQYAESLAIVARGQALAPAAPWWDALRQRILLARPGAERSVVASTRSVSDFAPGALVRATALAADGRHAEASGVLAIVTKIDPTFCEARALLAGIRQQEGSRAEAARLSSEILQAASAAPDRAPWARCAAMAAAGIGDAQQTAVWINRAATDERALRLWLATGAVLSPTSGIRQKTFPWNNVLKAAQVAHAVAGLESALVRVRADAAKILEGLDLR